MNKETLQFRKAALEAEFKKAEESRAKAQEIVASTTQLMIRLQGAFALIQELEKELEALEEKKDTPEVEK